MCTQPLKAWIVGKNDSGKNKLKITCFDVDHLEVMARSGKVVCVREHDNPDPRHSNPKPEDISDYARSIIRDYITIPCGKCLDCLKQRGQEWTNRCLLEYMQHPDDCWFVTLTYRDADLPVTFYDDPTTGEAFPAYTLCKKHIQDFLKRCRKYFFGNEAGTLRYYCAGEYGPTTMRPHYHMILFGAPFDLNKLDHVVGTEYNTSIELDRLWPHGFHSISPATPETMAYVCHYVTGKLDPDNKALYDLHHMTPPFALMSRRPGIGNGYYEDKIFSVADLEKDIYVATTKGSVKVKTPASFRRLAELDGIIDDEYKRNRRKKSQDRLDIELARTNVDYYDYLETKDRIANSKYKLMLERNGIDD